MGQDTGGYSSHRYVIVDPGVFLPLFLVQSFLTKRFQKPQRASFLQFTFITPFDLGREAGRMLGRGARKPIHGKVPKISPKPKSSKQKNNSKKKTPRQEDGVWICLLVLLGLLLLLLFQWVFSTPNKTKKTHTSHTFNFSFPFHPSNHQSIHEKGSQ